MAPPIKSPVLKSLLRVVLSYGVAGACLYWIFRDLNFREVFHSFAAMDWGWVPAAIVFDLLVYIIAGWEWQVLLRPVGRVSILRTTQAVFAGRFANDVLPFHVGYAIRVYLVSRWTRARIISVAPSLLAERLFDGFWLALGIGWTAIRFRVPERVTRIAEVLGGVILAGLIAGAVLMFGNWQESRGPGSFSGKWSRKFRDAAMQVLHQLRAIGRSWLVLAGFGLSFIKFLAQGLAFLFLLWAYGFQLPFICQLAVFVIAYIGISVPSTPAGAGVFQLFCVAGLELFHVPKPAAAGFALLAFIILTAPLSIAGFLAMAQTGLSLKQIRAEARDASRMK